VEKKVIFGVWVFDRALQDVKEKLIDFTKYLCAKLQLLLLRSSNILSLYTQKTRGMIMEGNIKPCQKTPAGKLRRYHQAVPRTTLL
jgi:hypothetical protein